LKHIKHHSWKFASSIFFPKWGRDLNTNIKEGRTPIKVGRTTPTKNEEHRMKKDKTKKN